MNFFIWDDIVLRTLAALYVLEVVVVVVGRVVVKG